ncbi:MAG: nickel/cobalt transporter [Gaiellaceae bacterium]
MKKVVLAVALAAVLLAPAAASAHPLGNFTINRFSRVEVAGHRLYVRYVLDMAEIPTYLAREQGVDPAAYARRIGNGLRVELAGRPVRLVPVERALAFPLGQGGLHTMRLEVVLRGPAIAGRTPVSFRDANYAGHIGWKEVVVGAGTRSVSDELHAYPRNLLQSPLDETSVRTVLAPTSDPAPTVSHGPELVSRDRAVADSGFSSLIARRHLSALVILASLAAALFWGAAHALSPGHGKTIVTAYLVGQRGTLRHAALLGLIVTATHTVGVFGLGIVTLALSQFIVPETLYPWLNLVAGAMVVAVGAGVLRARVREWKPTRAHALGHDHEHGHSHRHGHDHGAGGSQGLRGLVGVGVSGGLLPCPSALVVLLAAISLHRVAFGLVLILAFSAGLALAITGVGLAAVLAKKAFARASFEGRLLRALPALSATVILAAGLAMTLRALPKVG